VSLERRNPLPAGRYWQDFFGDQRQKFRNWREQARPHVKVLATEAHEATDQSKPRDWVLFETDTPLPWDAVALGFPTIAGPAVTSSADTVQRPDPEPAFDPLKAVTAAGLVSTVALGVISAVVAHLVISKLFK
jgi:hypothetical protein